MTKRKRNHSRSSSRKREGHRRHKRRARSRDRSRNRSCVSPNLSRDSSRRRSREPSTRRSPSRDKLLQTLSELMKYVQGRETSSRAPLQAPETPASRVLSADISPLSDASVVAPASSDTHADEQTALLSGRGSVPEEPSRTEDPGNVTFSNPEVTEVVEDTNVTEETLPDTFVRELLGEQAHPPVTTSWLPVLLATTTTDIRSGLKEELKKTLLSKYELTADLSFLIPPKVNKEILPNLNATVITRDKHQTQSQLEVGSSLNALASGFSELSRLDFLQASPDGRTALTKIAEGIRLLADHHYGLSKTRRAFIVPSLNLLGKTASDSTTVDEYLFGNNFADEINVAQAIEKVAHKTAKKSQQMAVQKPQPPSTHPPGQQRNQPFRNTQPISKNMKAPPRKGSSSHPLNHPPRKGFFPSSHSNRRSRSRSRAHR